MNNSSRLLKRKSTIGVLFNNFRKQRAGNIIIVTVAIQILAIIIALIFPEKFRYLTSANLQVLFKSIPQIGIISVGVGLLMIAGEFDLTVGATFTFTALLMAKAFNSGIPIVISVLISLSVGILIGLVNGLIVVKLRVASFIVTLGTMYFWRGMILLVSQSSSERFAPSNIFTTILTGNIGPIQMQFVWLLIVVFIGWYILERTKFGNHIFATGGNKSAARALSINTDKVKIIAFIITGFLAAFSGIVSTTRVGTISPIQGEGLELQAIAACVIGGIALMGGEGSIIGSFFGAALLFTIQDFLLLAGAPGVYLKLFVGLIIIVAVVLNQVVKKEE
jgi:simple sugar transport system permease protein